jgi:uncharacterized membrane protein
MVMIFTIVARRIVKRITGRSRLPLEFCVWVPLPLRLQIMIDVLFTDEVQFTRNHVQNVKTSRLWTQENPQ